MSRSFYSGSLLHEFNNFSAEEDISSVVNQHLPKSCDGCNNDATLDLWPHVAKNPVLLSVGHIRKTEIPVLICTNCELANYPDMTAFGVFPLHNKCLLSLDYIIEMRDSLPSGKMSFKLI